MVSVGEDGFVGTRLLDASFNFEDDVRQVDGDDDEEEDDSEEDEDDEAGFFASVGLAISLGFSSAYTTIKRAVVSEETENIMSDALKMANKLLDSEYSSVQILAAVRILSTFRSNRPTLTNISTQNMGMLRHAFYWWQFAEAAFGWGLVHGLKMEAGLRGFAAGAVTSNDEVLEKYCKLRREDIRYTQWESRPLYPGNFVAVDHRTRSIVWAVRGTYSLGDVLTDIMAHSKQWLAPEYVAHAGMAQAVDGLLERVWPCVQQLLLDHPGYWLVTTGHSMGAAVASMLAMWVRHHHPAVQVVCWAFACPPCVSLNLAETTRDYIFGIIQGDDVIPRLSLQSMDLLKQRLRFVLEQNTGWWTSMTGGPEVAARVEEALENAGVLVGDRWAFELEMEQNYDLFSQRLWGPVRQLYIYEVGDKVMAEESECRNFAHIVLSNSFFKHHLPTEYDRVLIKLIKQLKRAEQEASLPAHKEHAKHRHDIAIASPHPEEPLHVAMDDEDDETAGLVSDTGGQEVVGASTPPQKEKEDILDDSLTAVREDILLSDRKKKNGEPERIV